MAGYGQSPSNTGSQPLGPNYGFSQPGYGTDQGHPGYPTHQQCHPHPEHHSSFPQYAPQNAPQHWPQQQPPQHLPIQSSQYMNGQQNYAIPQGHSQPFGSSSPTGFGQPHGHSQTQNYGTPQGYGQPPGYSQSPHGNPYSSPLMIVQQPQPQRVMSNAYPAPSPLAGPPLPGQAVPGSPQGPQYLFPPTYNCLVAVGGGDGSYPPQEAPPSFQPLVPYNHDFRSAEGARAPQLLFPAEDPTVTECCEVVRAGFHVELNYSMGFVALDAIFQVPSTATPEQLQACTFQLPQNNNCAVVMCEFYCGAPDTDRSQWAAHEVSCLAKSDAQALAEKGTPKKDGTPRVLMDSDPACFKILVPGVVSGHQVFVKVVYSEKIESFGGTYELRLPVGFSEGHMPLGEIHQRCVVTFGVNSGMRNFESHGFSFPGTMGYCLRTWSTTHQLWTSQESPTRLRGMVVSSLAWPLASLPPTNRPRSSDVVLCYTTTSDAILGHVVVDGPPMEASDPRSSFALFLCPPTVTPEGIYVFRRVIFVIDKSYSMDGAALNAVKRAVRDGVSMLRREDFFAIVAFSGAEQISLFPTAKEGTSTVPYSRTGFLSASTENKALACGDHLSAGWINSVVCDGGTDILAAMQTVKGIFDATRAEAKQHGLLDTCFMLTDGAVSNEHDVCLYVERELTGVRMLTFGVGGYVNTAFLRMMARIGQGFYEQSLNEMCIQDQMVHLMSKTSAPLLTDVTIAIEGELFPRKIPDLYMSGPLVVTGKFMGRISPSGTVIVRGRLHGQILYTMEITPESNAHIPVHKLCVRAMLEDLTSDAWLHQSAAIQQRVTDISCEENVPSAFTQQVTHQKVSEEEKAKKSPQKKGAAKTALLVGGTLVGGAGIYLLAKSGTFDGIGDLASTVANSPVVDAMGDGLAASGDMLGVVGSTILDFGSSAGAALADGAAVAGGYIADGATTAYGAVADGTVGNAVVGGAQTAGGAIADGATTAYGAVADGTVGNAVVGGAQTAGGVVADGGSAVAESDCCSTIAETCTEVLSGVCGELSQVVPV